MKSSLCLWIVLSLPALVHAIPTVSQQGLSGLGLLSDTPSVKSTTRKRPLSRERAANLIVYTQEKYANTLTAYERNTGSRHPLDTRSSSRPASNPSKRTTPGIVPLHNQEAELWYGNISVGSPPQYFTVDFDTGSSDLMLPSNLCVYDCEGHRKYDPAVLNTARLNARPFVALYGSGGIGGFEQMDTVNVAGYQIEKQALGAATIMLGFSKGNFAPDGLAGMAFRELSNFDGPTLMESLNNSGKLPRPVFSFKFSTQDGQSELVVGDVNATAFKANTVVPVDVTTPGYWEVSLDSISTPTGEIDSSRNVPAIIDTGTTLITAPKAIVQDYFATFPDAKCGLDGVCTVACTTIDRTTPTLRFSGTDFKVSPETWNLGPLGDDSTTCMAGLGIFAGKFIIVGDVFLRNVYTMFNFGYPYRVEFAELA